MTGQNYPSLDVLQTLFREGKFDETQQGVQAWLTASPGDQQALILQRHLDHVDLLKQINRVAARQEWDAVVEQVQQAINAGLSWDLELHPLSELLDSAKERRAQAAQRKAQTLMRRAEEAEEQGDRAEARDLYAEAIDLPYLPIPFRAQIQHRLDDLHGKSRATIATTPALGQPDALMEQLVVTILNKSRPQVAEAVRLCAVPFWFDLELLVALRDSDDNLEEKILERMARFSFIHQDDRERYTFSEDVRRYLQEEWAKDREGFLQVHRRARAHFLERLHGVCQDQDLIKALAMQSGPLAQSQVALNRTMVTMSPETSELLQDYLYHTLVVDGDAGVVLLRQLFHAADESYRLATAERYLDMANEQRAWLNPEQRAHVDYLRGRLDQAQGRWQASQERFERMLSHEGLSSTLQARVRRALGNTLVQREQWVEAIALFEIALKDFQTAGDDLESALTMIDLGHAHLDLGLNTWGGGQAFNPDQSRWDIVRDIVSLIGRLPIAVYLIGHLGVRALLPVILRVGRDMDWIVARLFVMAAGWFNRADTLLRRLNDDEGLGRVEENLAWLYLLLGHFGRAETIYRRLLAREGITVGEYRSARARLGLAEALLRHGQPAQARELLEKIHPIFVTYQHTERIAQTQTLLAQACILEKQVAPAVSHYQQAAQLYHQLDDDASATEVVEQMQLVCALPQTDAATRQSIETTAAQITRRRYLTRFSLPLLYIFRLLALVGLAGVFFFGLFTSIQVESGTDFGVGQAVLGAGQNVTAAMEPDIQFSVVARLESSSEVSLALYLILVFVALYLGIYALLGLWLTVRTSLRTLQEGQQFDIIVDSEGVGRGAEGTPGGLKISWTQVGALLTADRSVFRTPIQLFSRFGIFSEQGSIIVDGQTRRYAPARNFILQHLSQPNKSIPTYNFGFSIFHSHSGRLFVVTLLSILALVVIAQVSPQTLSTPLHPLPYSLANLHSISYLGLLFPLGWWLGVQPLRERLFLKPHTRRVWLIGLSGALLAAFTVADLLWLKLRIGRPNVAPGLFAAFLVGLAAFYVVTTRRWERMAFLHGDFVYALPLRLISAAAALAIIGVTLGLVGREALAYHYLAVGNMNRHRAAETTDPAQAQRLYENALTAYERAGKWVQDDADAYHSQGATLSQLGRYDEAVAAIQRAVEMRPGRLEYYNSLAITFEIWAKAQQETGDNERAQALYTQARDNYTYVIQKRGPDDPGLAPVYVSRAGASFQIGEYYRKHTQQRGAVIENYEAARSDYAWVIKRQPDNVAALSGLGWVAYQSAKIESNPSVRRETLLTTLSYFEQAATVDPRQIPAWTGQGWTHFAIGETYTWYDESEGRVRSACADSQRNPRTEEEVRIYLQENLDAIAAFEQAAALAQNDPGLYSVQGYIYFNLVDCPDASGEEIYQKAIQSFDQALKLEPNNVEWHLRRGNLYYALIQKYDRDYYAQVIADYEAVVALQPNPDWYWFLGFLYRQAGDMDKAVDNYASSVELTPTDYEHQVLLGWWAYQGGDYELSIQASQAAIRLDPSDPRPFFNWGLALVAAGRAEEAWQVYDDGLQVAQALIEKNTAVSRLGEAIGDLGDVTQDPSSVAEALRVRLTFKKALLYVGEGATEEARSAYEAGIAIAQGVEDYETWQALFDEAAADLRSFGGSGLVVEEMVALLEAADR
jgi:tetratricopeptide (TPR) repeat protein